MTEALWSGDTGTLSYESRRALVDLLKGPLISADRKKDTWNAILSDKEALRSWLHDVFLELVIDEEAGIAFTRHVRPDNDDVHVPPVLRTDSLTHLQTAVLLQLRHELGMSTPGERVVVGEDELYTAIGYVRAVDNRDEAGFKRRFDAAINAIKNKYSLLTETETEGRYVVSPVLRHIFDADTVYALREEYLRLAGANAGNEPEGEEQ
ncbi:MULTISPECIES: DUF4194 domain-containing protein [Corynebacterium]|uniref:Uncharacterized protein n=1 Tax=Corynebacterium riegelii TaxID=156976 RepID=A0A0K1RDE4_9CORY|nr:MULTISPECIES: DUF4194 domain-containing protein [Corynebacterium]AKV59447.1 hypothetical protein AK829_10245 [Corynebacterium riegelii]OFT78117.1 hypothetical protein HMPREF3104_00325 [Corynebacterium sp. HMSC30G07]PLA14355.1 DUF4194 domain-containing protein [Corynebacterium riegelii]